MAGEMVTFIQHDIILYWTGSSSARLVNLDPRRVNVEVVAVPLAEAVVGAAMTYV